MRAFPLRRILAIALSTTLACPILADAGALSQAQCAQGNPSAFSGQGSCTSVAATSAGGTQPNLTMSQPSTLSPDGGTPPPNTTPATWGGGGSGGGVGGFMKEWGPTLGGAAVVAGMSLAGFLVGGPVAGFAMLALGGLGLVGMKLMGCGPGKKSSDSSSSGS